MLSKQQPFFHDNLSLFTRNLDVAIKTEIKAKLCDVCRLPVEGSSILSCPAVSMGCTSMKMIGQRGWHTI